MSEAWAWSKDDWLHFGAIERHATISNLTERRWLCGKLRDAVVEVERMKAMYHDAKVEMRAANREALRYRAENVRLTAELAEARKDVIAVSTAFTIDLPKPGSDLAKIMLVNQALIRERDAARDGEESALQDRDSG